MNAKYHLNRKLVVVNRPWQSMSTYHIYRRQQHASTYTYRHDYRAH
jgi:hypothetical protein